MPGNLFTTCITLSIASRPVGKERPPYRGSQS